MVQMEHMQVPVLGPVSLKEVLAYVQSLTAVPEYSAQSHSSRFSQR